ncbi:MAG TPA: hypothetical protein VN520_12010 [Streptomyces sp.]|uniref:hypothetical protein n=1 Tax=Streptomyces sp. TaxID=1931 RepID=UPI002C6F248C|nr:hypothetical protein [Streptomyces sp.]HWU07086.1 hypothetical protein [Streptomyces sp.]
MELPDRAAPGVEALAGAAADAACALADAAGPAGWNLAAAEDAAEAIDTLAAALSDVDPEAARLLAAIPAATKALLRHFGQEQETDAVSATAARPSQLPKPRRRGLGPGWQGLTDTSVKR